MIVQCPFCCRGFSFVEPPAKTWCVVVRRVAFGRGRRDVLLLVTTDRKVADAAAHEYRSTGYRAEVIEEALLSPDVWRPLEEKSA